MIASLPPTTRRARTGSIAKRRSFGARMAGLDACEERLMMTAGLAAGGANTLTGPEYNGLSLANQVGFKATAPTLSADGQSIVFGFDNTGGTGPVTVDIATYLVRGTSIYAPLSTQVYEGVQAITLAKGQSQAVAVPFHTCVQLDAFIANATLNGKAVGSAPIQQFSPVFDDPAYGAYRAPSVDTGYNTNNFVPTSPNAPIPAGTLGTLVSYALTTGPNGGASNDYCPDDTFTGKVVAACNGTSTPLAGQEVDLVGTGYNGPISLKTTTDGNGNYTFTVPYAALPAANLTVTVPLANGQAPVAATPGTVDGATAGKAATSATAESISGIALNYGGLAATGYNFQVAPPASVAGTVFADATGNGLAADGSAPGDSGLAGVVVQLLNPAGQVVYTSAPTTATGTYSISGVPAGTYAIKEILPAGYMQTGSSAGSTLTLAACQNATGVNFAALPTCDSSKITGLSFTDVSSNGVKTYPTLHGNTNQGDQVTANFTNSGTMPITVTLVSYAATQNMDLTQQSAFQVSTQTVQPGATAHLTVQIPNSYYQIDFVCGTAITKFNPANNNTYHGEGRYIDSDNDGYEAAPGSSLAPTYASLSGQVFLDKNLNGIFNAAAGDSGIAGVTVQLTGTDALGKAVNLTRITGADGSYNFAGLQPGTYVVNEVQPAGYYSTRTKVGTVGGATVGTLTATNTIGAVALSGGNAAINYNFGEGQLSGCSLGHGEAASPWYWAGSNGQCLLGSLNGGSSSTKLGSWLASTLPNLFSGLAGKTNAQVAAYAASLVGCNSTQPNAGILALALSGYVTDSGLAGNVAQAYGFTVTAGGTLGCTVCAGDYLAGYGGPTGTITIGQFLEFANDQSSNGVLGHGDCNLTKLLNDGICYIIWNGDIKEC